MKPHCPKVQTAIADDFIDEDEAVPLPVKSGGVVIFHPLVPHASLVNTTTAFAGHLTFASKDRRTDRAGAFSGICCPQPSQSGTGNARLAAVETNVGNGPRSACCQSRTSIFTDGNPMRPFARNRNIEAK